MKSVISLDRNKDSKLMDISQQNGEKVLRKVFSCGCTDILAQIVRVVLVGKGVINLKVVSK